MSIVVAVRKHREIVVASDTQSSFGSIRVTPENLRDVKIRQVGASWLAQTGWCLYDDVMDDFIARQKRISLSNRRAIFTFFLKLWKDLHDRYHFVNDQCDKDDTSPFGDLDSQFMIVNRKGIFHVSRDMSITCFSQYFAIGSGADFALGAVFALYDSPADAEELAVKGVRAAVTFDTKCGGDVDVRRVKL